MAAEILADVLPPRSHWPGMLLADLSEIAWHFGVLYARGALGTPDDSDSEAMPPPLLEPEELAALDSAIRGAHQVHAVSMHVDQSPSTPDHAALIVVSVLHVTSTWREVYPALERLCNLLGAGPGFRHLDRRLDALRALAVDYARSKLTKTQLGDASRWLDSLEGRQHRPPA